MTGFSHSSSSAAVRPRSSRSSSAATSSGTGSRTSGRSGPSTCARSRAHPGVGFLLARDLLRSKVRLERSTVYELSPESVGEFEIVVCGSLLLHLRDPLRGLAAIRSVCRERLLCTNQVELGLSLLHRRRALARLDGTSGMTQWWLPNAAGHRQMLRASGFEIERESGLYAIPYGPAHPPVRRRPRPLLGSIARRSLTGNDGVVHHAVLARPRVDGSSHG